MSLIIDSPTQVQIRDHNDSLPLVKAHLTYTDKSVDFQIRRLKQARWFDAEAHAERLAELQEARKKCLLLGEEEEYYTLSGLAEELSGIVHAPVENRIIYPEAALIPWAKVPPELRPYQQEVVDLCLEHKHAATEMATGLGKSFMIMHLAKRLGLKAVIMAPTTSIAEQLYDDFVTYLGKSRVGRYFGGKKDSSKLVTIAIHASLVRIEPGDDDWIAFSGAKVFIADESHLCPAATLYKVCMGLLAEAPYRFFFSGTQMRGDGADLLLRGITGPIYKRMTVKDGVDQGYLAKPVFRVLQVLSNDGYVSDDPLKMNQRHLFYNPIVLSKAAAIANSAVRQLGHQVLILVDEVKQFRYLTPLLRYETKFAHGPLTKENMKDVPPQFVKVDNKKLVKEFNEKKYPILIGTSAIGMGTDIKSVNTLIYLKGGKSEVEVRQGVGRGTRKTPDKDECTIIDFDVTNVDLLHRHALERIDIYRDIYPDLEIL